MGSNMKKVMIVLFADTKLRCEPH